MSLVENAIKRMRESAQAGQLAAGSPRSQGLSQLPEAASRSTFPRSQVLNERVVPIHRPSLRAAGLLPPESQEQRISRQYRQIKRPLIASILGRGGVVVDNGRVLLVTSALPGEGKTFTSLNLALSLSLEQDFSVVLVDTDVLKPHITEQLGLQNEKGLFDALRDPLLDVETLILATDMPGLYVLPVGTNSKDATELLSSARMAEVVRTLASVESGRVAVLDSPPVLLTSEAPALAEVAGQIVMVVRAGHTGQQDALDALDLINAHSNVSLLLNQSVAKVSQDYPYGYGAVRDESDRGSSSQV